MIFLFYVISLISSRIEEFALGMWTGTYVLNGTGNVREIRMKTKRLLRFLSLIKNEVLHLVLGFAKCSFAGSIIWYIPFLGCGT